MRAPALTFYFLLLLTGSVASAAEPPAIGGRHVVVHPKARAAAPIQLPAR